MPESIFSSKYVTDRTITVLLHAWPKVYEVLTTEDITSIIGYRAEGHRASEGLDSNFVSTFNMQSITRVSAFLLKLVYFIQELTCQVSPACKSPVGAHIELHWDTYRTLSWKRSGDKLQKADRTQIHT